MASLHFICNKFFEWCSLFALLLESLIVRGFFDTMLTLEVSMFGPLKLLYILRESGLMLGASAYAELTVDRIFSTVNPESYERQQKPYISFILIVCMYVYIAIVETLRYRGIISMIVMPILVGAISLVTMPFLVWIYRRNKQMYEGKYAMTLNKRFQVSNVPKNSVERAIELKFDVIYFLGPRKHSHLPDSHTWCFCLFHSYLAFCYPILPYLHYGKPQKIRCRLDPYNFIQLWSSNSVLFMFNRIYFLDSRNA